jgi:hypothetical protein
MGGGGAGGTSSGRGEGGDACIGCVMIHPMAALPVAAVRFLSQGHEHDAAVGVLCLYGK